MKNITVCANNRADIQRRYIDHILGSLNFLEIKDKLRDYLNLEKDKESDESLEAEILHEASEILVDNWEDLDSPILTKEN